MQKINCIAIIGVPEDNVQSSEIKCIKEINIFIKYNENVDVKYISYTFVYSYSYIQM